MTQIVLLLFLGFVLIFLETVLIGGIWALAGSALCAWAVWIAYFEFGIPAAIAVALLSIGVGIAAILVWLFVLPKTAIGRQMYLNSVQRGKAPSVDIKGIVGKEGIALTPLMPSGKVEISGVPYDARCEQTYIDRGARVKVVSANSFELRVDNI